MQFYEKYLELCNSVGKAPSKVILEIGLKKSAVTRWKAGGLPTDATLQKIADYFNVSTQYFSGEEKKPTGTAADELDSELINLLLSLTPKQIANVTAYIQGMLSK